MGWEAELQLAYKWLKTTRWEVLVTATKGVVRDGGTEQVSQETHQLLGRTRQWSVNFTVTVSDVSQLKTRI